MPHASASVTGRQAPPLKHRGAFFLALAGDWLRRHQRFIRRLQWGIIAVYVTLLVTPTLVPLPDSTAHIWDNITLFSQFVFWGIWWPGVLVSMLLFGRLWCGIMCPEGALSEMASRHGRGRAIPRWIRWPGWPFSAFVITTIYGQMISVYQYPLPAVLILGGSTAAAILTGYLYGRNHRVWCRYLCPVNGVFGLLAKLAPMHYGVDRQNWDNCLPHQGRADTVICAPMVPLRTMQSTSPCHMCGRCAGFRNAIELRPRDLGSEVIKTSANTATRWDSWLILCGMIGVASGAFLWSSSPWFVMAKQWMARILVQHDVFWPLEHGLPWWGLTNYPELNDVLTLLDGAILLGYIAVTALVMTLATGLPLAFAARLLSPSWKWRRFHHLVHGLLPIAGCGIVLGLSAQTVTILRADGMALGWISDARMTALALATSWSIHLIWKICGQYNSGPHRSFATLGGVIAVAVCVMPWLLLFWVW